MRKLPGGGFGGMWLAAALLSVPAWAPSSNAAERTMRFRPVPAESASTFDRTDMAAERDRERAASDSARAERRRSLGGVPAPPGEPSVPEPPEPPAPPEEPTMRSTRGDLVRFGSDITIRPGELIEGDVVSFGGDIEVLGHVTGNVSAMGGDVTLRTTARVDHDVVCIGGQLREESGSSVGGQRVTAPRSPGAKIFFPVLAVVGTGFQMLAHAAGALLMIGFAWLFAELAPPRTQAPMDQRG